MRAAVIWLALALCASACTPGLPGAASAQVEVGQIERLDDESWVAVTRADPGDRIRAVGDATLSFGADRILLRQGSEGTLGDRALDLDVGDALAEGQDLSLTVGEDTVSGAGAIFRIQAGVTPRVSVYRGLAQVVRPGEGQQVGALRQLALSARRFDGTDAPLAYDGDDPFDQRLMADAIAFDGQIANLVSAIDAQYGAAPQPAAFYTSFVSVADPDLQTLTRTAPTVTDGGEVGPPADALVGLFVARALADVRDDGDLLRAGEDIRTLRDQGARWGLVAMAHGVSSVAFAAVVDQAVERRDDAVAAGAPTDSTTAAEPASARGAATPDVPAPDAPGSAAPPLGAGGGGPDAAAPPPPAAASPPPPPPPPPPPAVDPGTVGQVLEDVLDLLPEPGEGLLGSAG